MHESKRDTIAAGFSAIPRSIYIVLALWIGVNVAVIPLLTDTTATIYGAIGLATFGVWYLWVRVRRQAVS